VAQRIAIEQGELELDGQRLSIGSAELREPRYRVGGLSNVDLHRCPRRRAPYENAVGTRLPDPAWCSCGDECAIPRRHAVVSRIHVNIHTARIG
jgi:hypothetical protein